MSALMEAVSAVLALAAVWLIGGLDVRGQWLMLAAQVSWALFALLGGHWWLLAQSLVLLCMTVRAIRKWSAKRPAAARVGP
jgi:hypothetical protein